MPWMKVQGLMTKLDWYTKKWNSWESEEDTVVIDKEMDTPVLSDP